MTLSDVRALTFDVFGTVVDWRSTVIREVTAALGEAKGLSADWETFADRWRFEGYVGGIQAIRRASAPSPPPTPSTGPSSTSFWPSSVTPSTKPKPQT